MCSDFEAFKEMMLSYKQEVLGNGLKFDVQVSCVGWRLLDHCLTSHPAQVHASGHPIPG